MGTAFSYRHRRVSEADVDFIRQLIAQHPEASRRRLSEKLCQAWHWVQPNGKLRDQVCRSLMLALHRAGQIELPPVRRVLPNPIAERRKPRLVPVDTTPFCATLEQIQPLEFHQVRHTPQEALFNSLLEQHHYLGHVQPIGENLKFLVSAQQRPIACLAWSSAPRHLASRDRFIGWSAETRRANLRYIAYNVRFLVLPWVAIPHAASHILARMARRLSNDWQQVYGHPLYFLETFIDPQRFRGTCYRAANWIVLGSTTGRGKNDIQHRGPNRPIKQVLGYPLCTDFRRRLQEVAIG